MKECEWCGSLFNPRTKNTKFCSSEHFAVCQYCKKKFLIKNMKKIPSYCSISCSSKDKKYCCTCAVCGEEFVSNRRSSKICQRQHYKECVVCQKMFPFNPRNSRQPKTCSKKCSSHLVDFKSRQAKTVETLKRKYGTTIDNVSQIPIVQHKKEQTMMDAYGVKNPSLFPEFVEKRKETSLSKYGVDNPAKSLVVKDQIKRTNIDKYGVENVSQSQEVKDKIRKTLQKKYGENYTNPFQVPEIQEKVKKSLMEKFGVSSVLELPEIQKLAFDSNKNRISKINKKWGDVFVNDFHCSVDFEVQFAKGMYADIQLNKNILIDINPTVTHNNTISWVHLTKKCIDEQCINKRHLPVDKKYHFNRFLASEENGKILLQYFDWYDKSIFLSIVRSKLHLDEYKVYARHCDVRQISQYDANIFLNENHLLGATKGQSFCVGLFYHGEMVHLNSYGRARMNKNYQWEAIRSCSKKNWHVQGGLQKADSFFKKKTNPESIISYVDLALGGGDAERQNPGWRLLSTNQPSATWVKLQGKNEPSRFIKDSSVRKISADRLLGMRIGEKYPERTIDGGKITNSDVLLAEGYVKVYNAGTRTFVWNI